MPIEPRTAAFLALSTVAKPYADYPEASSELAAESVPMVAMVHRWEGTVGFPGGLAEPGEDPLSAALREADEELAFRPNPEELARIVLVDDRSVAEGTRALLFSLALPEVRFRQALRDAASAPHALSEGWAFPARFRNDPAPAFDNLMASPLAPGVRAEAEALARHLGWDRTWLPGLAARKEP